jgi:hypothetical protein
MFSMFFLGALYLQRVLHYNPLEVGLAFLPSTLVMGTLSLRYTERLNMRFGPKATLLPALGFLAVGLLLFTRTPVDGSYITDVAPPVMLIGLGAGLGFPSLMMLAMSGATPSDSGLASGLVNATVQVGGAVGLAVLATVAANRTTGLLAGGEPGASALNSGFHLAYLVGTLLAVAAFVVAAVVLKGGKPDMSAMMGAEAPAGDEAHARGDGRDGRREPAYSEA